MSYRSRVAAIALHAVLLASPTFAQQKVVRFMSPTTDTIWLKGSATGLSWDAGTTKFLVSTGEGWYGYTFPAGASVPSGNYGFTTRDYSTQCQLSIDFTKGDTAWVFPDPFPGGVGRVSYSRPRTKTVMFWNPWEYDVSGKPPRLQYDGGGWNSMVPAGNLPGWYSYLARGYSAMDLAFSDSTNKKFVGAAWGAAAPYRVPSTMLESSDTIWVRPTPELSGGLVASALRPLPKVVMFFNPWDGRLPVNRPRISFSGGTLLPMVPSGLCGWYAFEFYDRSTTVSFANDHGGQTFGSGGLGSTGGIALATVLSARDTAWISSAPGTGQARVAANFTGEKGHCERVLLAATIRDFPSGTPENIEFGHGKGCGRGGWGVVQGMVEPFLGPDRKPIRSPYDTGRAYPNDWSFSFRCVYDTIRPQSLSEIGDSGIATNWFRTVPGKNAETCRDIPLETDSVTGDYVYDNQHYFPIDDFTHLPDGTRNPYHATVNGDDGKPHNYGFCLESHGEFEYTKGQVFDFRGDDDVWFFIDGRIAVDLGGSHGPARDSVLLDSIRALKTVVRDANGQIVYTKTGKDSMLYTPTDSSLVPGRTYTFDFFFCERNPLGSSMRIRTDMNLRTVSGFQLRDSTRSDGSRDYAMWMSTTTGQGCAARNEARRTQSDRIRLSGPSANPPVDLGAGLHYGGIAVAADFGSFRIDTTRIVGLAPGRYQVSVLSPVDSTDVRRAVFVVPWTAEPRFAAKAPYAGTVGSSFPVSVASFNESGADSSAVAFQVRAVPGLSWFLDSQLTRPLRSDSVLRTPPGHAPMRIWVRGDSAGTYRLVVGRSATDSTDSWTDIAFFDKGIRFVDSLGSPVAPNVPVVRDVGDTVRLRIRAFDGSAVCATCVDSVSIVPGSAAVVALDASGKPAAGIRLVAGAGEFMVVGTASAESVSVAATSLESGKRAVRSPISFRNPVLRWIDASGRKLTSMAVDTSVSATVAVRLEVLGVGGPCAACVRSASLSASLPGIVFLDSTGTRRVDSAIFSGGRASLRVTGDRSVLGATLVASAPRLDTARLPSFTFRASAPDSGAWYDDDGDGAADRAVVHLHDKWTATTSLRLSWPDTAVSVDAISGTLSLSADSMTAFFRATTPLPGTSTSMADVLGRWSRDGGAWIPFPLRDRIAPVAASARLRWGGGVDTLRIAPSESLLLPAVATARVDVTSIGGTLVGSPLTFSVDPATGELVALYASGTAPEPGDSVRFAAGGVADASGNAPGASSRKVAISASARPPREATMLDVDGDGRADRVVLRFPSLPRIPSTFGFRWGASSAVLEERAADGPPSSTDSGGLVVVHDLSPFQLGVTSCPVEGCAGLGTMISIEGADTSRIAFTLLDGVAPVATNARLRWGSTHDTLRIRPSERLAAPAAASGLAAFDAMAGNAIGAPLSGFLDPVGGDLVLVYASGSSPLPGDSARLAAGASDLPGNRPGPSSRKVVVQGTDRPPYDAVMLDMDGDGSADRAILRFSSAPKDGSSFRFRWGAPTASQERIAGPVPTGSDSAGRIATFDLAPFPVGATSCPAPGCAGLGEMFLLDGADTVSTNFVLRDGVPPILTRARLRYAADDASPDTLFVDFSEPVASSGSSGWIDWTPAASTAGARAVASDRVFPSADGRSAMLLVRVDSSFAPRPGDLAHLGPDILADASANTATASNPWVPIELGPRPSRIDAIAYPAMRLTGPGAEPRPGEPPLRILVNHDATGDWSALDGAPVGDTSRFSGILLSLNAPVAGDVFVYDNLGVHVGGISLDALSEFVQSPASAAYQDGKGRIRAWIAWNGAGPTGKRAADGVYTLRLVVFARDGSGAVINRLHRIGRKQVP